VNLLFNLALLTSVAMLGFHGLALVQSSAMSNYTCAAYGRVNEIDGSVDCGEEECDDSNVLCIPITVSGGNPYPQIRLCNCGLGDIWPEGGNPCIAALYVDAPGSYTTICLDSPYCGSGKTCKPVGALESRSCECLP